MSKVKKKKVFYLTNGLVISVIQDLQSGISRPDTARKHELPYHTVNEIVLKAKKNDIFIPSVKLDWSLIKREL